MTYMIDEFKDQFRRWKQDKRIGFAGVIDDMVNDTIERCAQVADDAVDCRSRQEIAAKIRKLKDVFTNG